MTRTFPTAVVLLFGVCLAVGAGGPFAPVASAEPPVDITFDTLKFDIEKDGDFERSMLTEPIEKLNGKTVRLRGFILPASVFQQRGIKQFVLVRDNMECCFGPGAAIYDCVMVEMSGDESATFSTRPIAVEGIFHVREYKYPNGKHYAIYHLDGLKVK